MLFGSLKITFIQSDNIANEEQRFDRERERARGCCYYMNNKWMRQ